MNNNWIYFWGAFVICTLTFSSCAVVPSATSAYHGKSAQKTATSLANVKSDFAELLKHTFVYNKKVKFTNLPTESSVTDTKFEITYKSRVLDFNIPDIKDVEVLDWGRSNSVGSTGHYQYSVQMDATIFSWKDINQAKSFADAIAFLHQRYLNQIAKADEEAFAPIAAEYRALKVKPPVSEEQRKFIVQANSFNQQKLFEKAIEYYNKAIDLDQTAYPAAYSNIALLSAQLHKYDAAILSMKKYLLLDPNASDARGAQDKIYEWEIMLKQ
jgi:tetratricopeptide (TPR) repeat protein